MHISLYTQTYAPHSLGNAAPSSPIAGLDPTDPDIAKLLHDIVALDALLEQIKNNPPKNAGEIASYLSKVYSFEQTLYDDIQHAGGKIGDKATQFRSEVDSVIQNAKSAISSTDKTKAADYIKAAEAASGQLYADVFDIQS